MRKYVLYIQLVIIFISFATGAGAATVYIDVAADHWASASIDWVSKKGIMTGPAGAQAIFLPQNPVNRAELATVITRTDARIQRRIDELESRIAEIEHTSYLLEQLLNKPQ
jgi:S-layer homology domain